MPRKKELQLKLATKIKNRGFTFTKYQIINKSVSNLLKQTSSASSISASPFLCIFPYSHDGPGLCLIKLINLLITISQLAHLLLTMRCRFVRRWSFCVWIWGALWGWLCIIRFFGRVLRSVRTGWRCLWKEGSRLRCRNFSSWAHRWTWTAFTSLGKA